MKDYILKNKKIFYLLTNFFVFVIISSIFINKVHENKNNLISGLKPYILDGEILKEYDGIDAAIIKKQKDLTLWIKEDKDPKIGVSDELTDPVKYERFFNRDCKDLKGSNFQEERKRVRWLFPYLYYNLYNFGKELSPKAPYYLKILFFSVILFLTYFLTFKTLFLSWHYKFIFLFYLAFLFPNPLGEYQFSIVETFFVSLAIYASKLKKYHLFCFSVILAMLNRESGIVLAFLWPLFNEGQIKKVLTVLILTTIIFFTFNYDIAQCAFDPSFYAIFEKVPVQINASDLFTNISFFSSIKLILLNFIIPFGSLFYVIFSSEKKNKTLIGLSILYLAIFISAMPMAQFGARLILLPLLMTAFYLKQLKSN
tara:strand:+ start:780 stop:1886 length:1107 start_codon:yes stop_codon:yes gene_type:complete